MSARHAAPGVAYGVAGSPYAGWETRLISGYSGGGSAIWAMKAYFVPPVVP
jgi:hypothetical protein